jgi:hypothetical protein
MLRCQTSKQAYDVLQAKDRQAWLDFSHSHRPHLRGLRFVQVLLQQVPEEDVHDEVRCGGGTGDVLPVSE